MELPNTFKVAEKTNSAGVGKADKCFYCGQASGSNHALDCVCRKKVVMLKIETTTPVVVPSNWTAEDVEFHRNESTWCADNIVNDLKLVLNARKKSGYCMCNDFKAKYIREATDKDLVGVDVEELLKG